jgi:DNA invertase Pin-like site-specific DNA recombinase
MRVYYSRVSTQEQNEERQLQDIQGFDFVFSDKCSGSIEFFKRPEGSQIKELIDQKKLTHLEVHSIDRLGRSTIDVLKTWQELTELGIQIVCRNPNLTNFKSDGSEDEVSQMIISILSTMAKFERSMILQRQKSGIERAKLQGRYKGRKVGTKETKEKFIEKPRNQKILSFLKKGYKYNEICEIVGCSFSTINKVKSVSRELKRLREVKQNNPTI